MSELDPNMVAVVQGVRKAQAVLTKHIMPNGPKGEDTINELLGILDDHKFVSALNSVDPKNR